MPEREVVIDADPCDLAIRWGISEKLANRLGLAAYDMWMETRRRVWITSGFRTRAEQAGLRRSGRPAAPDDVSTHRTCPATGADISMGFGVVATEKHIWGRILVMNGLRWGGGSPLNNDLIPTDWQHLDLGPRFMDLTDVNL